MPCIAGPATRSSQQPRHGSRDVSGHLCASLPPVYHDAPQRRPLSCLDIVAVLPQALNLFRKHTGTDMQFQVHLQKRVPAGESCTHSTCCVHLIPVLHPWDIICMSLVPSDQLLSSKTRAVQIAQSQSGSLQRYCTGCLRPFVLYDGPLHSELLLAAAGAGLGGGSGNAATALWAANEAAGRPASEADLLRWAGEIGSDISVFFSQGSAFCTGRYSAGTGSGSGYRHSYMLAWCCKYPKDGALPFLTVRAASACQQWACEVQRCVHLVAAE